MTTGTTNMMKQTSTTSSKNNKKKANGSLLRLALLALCILLFSIYPSPLRRDGEFFDFITKVEAWTFTSSRPGAKTTKTASKVATTTRLYYAAPDSNNNRNDDDEEENDIVYSTSSRRGWFRQVGRLATAGAAAAVGVSVGSLPAPASAEVGTAATMPETLEITSTQVSSQSKAQAQLVSSKAVCDSSVSVWKNPEGRIVYLLGTAHVSKLSAELAGQLVKDTCPDGVFVELDPKRLKPGSGILASKVSTDSKESKIIVPQIQMVSSIPGAVSAGGGSGGSAGEAGSSTSVASSSVLPASSSPSKSNNNPIMKAAATAVGNSIKGMYKQLDSAGFESGEEFVVAIKEGQKLGSDIVLGDRDVEVTLRRLTEGLAKTDIKALLSPDSELEQSLQALVPSSTSKAMNNKMAGTGGQNNDEQFREEFSSFVESMKTKENVKMIMGQLQRIAPFLYEALVSERDAYMAAGLNGLNELTSIVAVVGIAHVDGIETNLSLNGWKQMSPSCSKFR